MAHHLAKIVNDMTLKVVCYYFQCIFNYGGEGLRNYMLVNENE